MEKEKVVKIVVRIAVILVIVVAVAFFYKTKQEKYAKEQQRIKQRMKALRK